ncbi:hypothetical protein ROZALSC1DRAFT_17922, partial [Rozella allomycis CSF55]
GVLAGAGDIVSQIGIEKRDYKDYDQIRTARFMFIGYFVTGPSLNLWYKILERVVIESHPLKNMAKKVFLDQIVFAPFTTALFFVFNGLLERIPFDKIQSKLQKVWWSTLMTNYKIWPAVQMFNFYFVPLGLRLPFVCTIGLGWNSYLSYQNQKGSICN